MERELERLASLVEGFVQEKATAPRQLEKGKMRTTDEEIRDVEVEQPIPPTHDHHLFFRLLFKAAMQHTFELTKKF